MTRPSARLALAVVSSLLALLLVFPATASAEQLRPRGTAPTERVKMVDGNRFRPATIEISRGTRIKWVNRDNVAHTTTSNDGDWNERLNPGESFKRRFRRAGEFDYRCTIHIGMTGTVVVS